jgi:uncharacterized protein (DUF58 family)
MTTAKIDPVALMRIRNLQLRAKHVVEGFYSGLHRSPFHGFSVEFSQYRPYSSGDDPRGIDWKLFARTDRYHIKQFEDETSRRCYLVLDQSRSMEFRSIAYDKAEYARTLAATLAYFLILQRDSVGLLTFADEVIDFIAARHRPGHFRRMLVALERGQSGTSTSLVKPLDKIAQSVRRRGLVIFITDLLAPIEQLQQHLAQLRGRGHEVLVLRVLDPGEIDLRITQPTLVEDLETGRKIYVDPATAMMQYKQRFDEHLSQVQQACHTLGCRLRTMVTDQPLDEALFELVHASAFRGSGRGVS